MPSVQDTLKLTGLVKYPVKGELRLKARNIPVSLSAIGRYAGGGAYRPSKNIQASALCIRARAMDLADPVAVYAIYPEAIRQDHTDIFPNRDSRGTLTEDGKALSHIILAICSLGPELENASEEYAASQCLLEAYLLDATGTALLQAFSQNVKDMLAQVVQNSGFYWAQDFTPGYGPVELETQAEIFRLTDAGRIGVRLLESAMLWPLKSISFVAGLSARPSVPASRKGCETCAHSTCQFREKRSDVYEKTHHSSNAI